MNQAEKTKKKKPRRFSVLLTVAIASVVVVSAAVFVNQQIDINRLSQEKETVSAKLEAQLAENNELEAIVNSENKDDYVARIAREKFGYALPGEEIYYDIS